MEEFVNEQVVEQQNDIQAQIDSLTLALAASNGSLESIKKIASDFAEIQDVSAQKKIKIAEIDAYDKSNAVNEFTLQGNKMWRVLKEREDMRQSLVALKSVGIKEFTYWLDTTPLTMPVSQFEILLNAVEVYAIQCFNVTAQHKANVMALDTIEAIKTYHYEQGYPEKLVF